MSPLEIEFLDGAPLMELGARTRIRMLQRDAEGDLNPVRLADVAFTYSPLTWGRVAPTADPAVGLLEVVEVVESEDLLLAPTFSISASLSHFTGQTFQSERRVRLVAAAVEVELGFEVGQNGKFRPFRAADLKQPIDWTQARTGDPKTQTLVVRDGVPFVRLTSIEAWPVEVSIRFPNGETASLEVDGRLVARRPGEAPAPVAAPAPVVTPAPVAAPAPGHAAAAAAFDPAASQELALELPAPAGEGEGDEGSSGDAAALEALEADAVAPGPAPDPASVREELARLARYVASFGGAARERVDPRTSEGIRGRIAREVERVRQLVAAVAGEERAAFEHDLRALVEGHPEARAALAAARA